jgi:hypothetical protein
MIGEVVIDEPMNQPRHARPTKAPEVFMSQRSKVLRLERQIKDLKAQVRDLKAELGRKVRLKRFGSHRRYRCLHCSRVGKMSARNPCMRLEKGAES